MPDARSRSLIRGGWILLFAALAWIGPLPTLSSAADGGLKEEALTVAFTETAFLGVNRNDVEAGYKVLARTLGERRGYRILSNVKAFNGAEDLDQLLLDETVRMLVVNAWVFLEMDTSQLTPCFLGSAQGSVGRQYLLVTRRDSGLNSLADLRGKDVLVFQLANATLGRYWLETLIRESRFGDPNRFLARAEYVVKPSAAVLPVFFGKKSACVVDRAGFELMQELNPQVGKELKVLAESDILVDSVICIRNDRWPPGSFREDLIQTLGEFHLEPAGAQILTMFKADRLAPYSEEHIAASRRLHAAHRRLMTEEPS